MKENKKITQKFVGMFSSFPTMMFFLQLYHSTDCNVHEFSGGLAGCGTEITKHGKIHNWEKADFPLFCYHQRENISEYYLLHTSC